ncbi:MAG: hypothetical protein L3K04_05660 [Thermoplasmata archaeon]|nr:hypothetical protein [Thermoplasmata archaeon]
MTMKACPSCGSALEYEHSPAELESATCGTCERQFTLVTPGSGPATLVSESTEEEAETAAGPAMACSECGGSMQLDLSRAGQILATCDSCEHRVTFLASDGKRPWTPRAGREERGPPRDRDSAAGPSRPCRKCGGALQFSRDEEGNTVGECESCGNRFTLPPREDRGGPPRSYGRGRSDAGGGYRGRPSGPPRSYGRGRPSRYSDRDGGDAPDNRRRRRTRDE